MDEQTKYTRLQFKLDMPKDKRQNMTDAASDEAIAAFDEAATDTGAPTREAVEAAMKLAAEKRAVEEGRLLAERVAAEQRRLEEEAKEMKAREIVILEVSREQ